MDHGKRAYKRWVAAVAVAAFVIIGRRFFTSAVDEPYGGSSGSGGEYPPGKR